MSTSVTGIGDPRYEFLPMDVGRIMMSSSRSAIGCVEEGLTMHTPLRRTEAVLL